MHPRAASHPITEHAIIHQTSPPHHKRFLTDHAVTDITLACTLATKDSRSMQPCFMVITRIAHFGPFWSVASARSRRASSTPQVDRLDLGPWVDRRLLQLQRRRPILERFERALKLGERLLADAHPLQ